MIDITRLEMTLDKNHDIKVDVWVSCHEIVDLEVLGDWLGLAKNLMVEWEKIRQRRPPPPANVTHLTTKEPK